jgi:trehalose 6-phosphate phosphatase
VPHGRLRDIASHPQEAGILLDFDGTLSDIAPTPEDARPVEGAATTLEALAGWFRIVAVVSGRRAREVAGILGANVRYLGLYGREDGSGTLSDDVLAMTERLLPDVEQVAAEVPGARVEHKGAQLAVHYRAASDPDAAEEVLRKLLGKVASAHGLTLLEGKRVLELTAPGAPTKGDVVVRLATEEGLRSILYAGDDAADLEAFAAVDRLGAEGVIGAKVAVRSVETPERLLGAADLVVEGPRGLVELLRSLLQPGSGLSG